MTRRLSENEKVDIIDAFTLDLESAQSLAVKYCRSRQAIYKVLKHYGIDPKEYGKMKTTCQCCGKEVERSRSQIRKQKHIFCSKDCYYAWLEASQGGSYYYKRYGQTVARKVVSEYFDLQPEHIVHHKDRNSMNNDIRNLMVFANQGDHIRYHRGGPKNSFDIKPLFDGAKIKRRSRRRR